MQLLSNLADGSGVYAFINMTIFFGIIAAALMRACENND